MYGVYTYPGYRRAYREVYIPTRIPTREAYREVSSLLLGSWGRHTGRFLASS